MHQAYQVHSILKQGVHIESIAAYDNNVILGGRSGQLIMYSVGEDGAVDMLMFNKNFSKKAIVQMEVIAAEKLLFVLTDGMIHVCDISRMEKNFTFIHSSQLTKGCSLFSLNIVTTKGTPPEGKTETETKTTTIIKVCCVIKKRLQFLYWKPNILESPNFDIELKDVPKTVCWVGDLICVGYKDEYVIFNIQHNKTEKHDLIATSSSHSMDPCICLLKDNILGLSKDEYLVAIDTDQYLKRKDDKSKMQQGSLDLDKAKGKNVFKPVAWSSPLLGLVWDEPYLVGRVASGIEVCYIEANGIDKIQSFPELNKTKYLIRSGRGIIFAAAISELWCIRMEDIATQRQMLVHQKQYPLAIDLMNVSDESELAKAEILRQLRMRYAKELFDLKQFSPAMNQFTKAEANPYDVIRLFPNLLQDQSSKTSMDNFDTTVPQVSKPQLEDKDLENALLALIEFLALARQKQVVKLRDSRSTSKSLLSVIDTTLLKCYLQTNDSLIAPLLRLNQCHLEESEKCLLKHDKVSDLIILYQNNGKHKKALELLKSQATKEGSNLFGCERTVRYLQQLGASHISLIKEFSDWVLKANPQEGFKIFTENLIEVENLPRFSVLDFLLRDHKPLVIPYLEHIIHVWNESHKSIHNILINQYKEKIQTLSKDLENDGSEPKTNVEEEVKQYRQKLCNMLENTNDYSPDVILKDFPTTFLLEERALILGRLKKHEKVLAIYIQILGDVEKACAYCEQNCQDEPDIFFLLAKTILNPLGQPPYEGVEMHKDFIKPNEDVAVKLLNNYATKIDPAKLWPFLPDELPVERLTSYLNTVLRAQTAHNHHMEMKRALLIAEIQRCTELVREQQSKCFEITEATFCAECRKRFANQSAFVRYPNGELVHLSCHDKRTMAVNLFGN